MGAPQKLTKKQKKGLAFRERKTGKNKNAAEGDMDIHDNAVPILENQDIAGLYGSEVEDERVEKKESKSTSGSHQTSSKGKEKAIEESLVGKTKKRKREAADLEFGQIETTMGERSQKRKKGGSKDDPLDNTEKVQGQGKQRFILFVGNLKYTTSKETIENHFAACDPPPSIRLLTPKPSLAGGKPNKSKGCAFLEFTHRNALQQALKLHQSSLDGRMINVELTAGGGGKSENRLIKVKERNKALFVQRDRIEKADPNDEAILMIPEKPQRYSATSGIDQAPTTKRSWTVGDVDVDKTHRGGVKHTKSPKSTRSHSKHWATGVNAIPVG